MQCYWGSHRDINTAVSLESTPRETTEFAVNYLHNREVVVFIVKTHLIRCTGRELSAFQRFITRLLPTYPL